MLTPATPLRPLTRPGRLPRRQVGQHLLEIFVGGVEVPSGGAGKGGGGRSELVVGGVQSGEGGFACVGRHSDLPVAQGALGACGLIRRGKQAAMSCSHAPALFPPSFPPSCFPLLSPPSSLSAPRGARAPQLPQSPFMMEIDYRVCPVGDSPTPVPTVGASAARDACRQSSANPRAWAQERPGQRRQDTAVTSETRP